MLDQLLDLAFFHLICAYHQTPDKRMGNRYKFGNLIHQIDRYYCIWSHCGNRVANLCL